MDGKNSWGKFLHYMHAVSQLNNSSILLISEDCWSSSQTQPLLSANRWWIAAKWCDFQFIELCSQGDFGIRSYNEGVDKTAESEKLGGKKPVRYVPDLAIVVLNRDLTTSKAAGYYSLLRIFAAANVPLAVIHTTLADISLLRRLSVQYYLPIPSFDTIDIIRYLMTRIGESTIGDITESPKYNPAYFGISAFRALTQKWGSIIAGVEGSRRRRGQLRLIRRSTRSYKLLRRP